MNQQIKVYCELSLNIVLINNLTFHIMKALTNDHQMTLRVDYQQKLGSF